MSGERGSTLLTLARNAIAQDLGAEQQAWVDVTWLDSPGACFVTLTQGGELRGCIGSLEAERPLRADVEANARAAAFRDPRFQPLTREDYPFVQVEVSLLSPSEPLRFDSEQQALAQLRPGIDGIVLAYGRQRSTFLPQVWEQLAEPRTFMAYLKQKAGLRADFWHTNLKLSRYTVEKWCERDHNTHRLEQP
jgi:AmmeMemoRadiSam system protein A